MSNNDLPCSNCGGQHHPADDYCRNDLREQIRNIIHQKIHKNTSDCFQGHQDATDAILKLIEEKKREDELELIAHKYALGELRERLGMPQGESYSEIADWFEEREREVRVEEIKKHHCGCEICETRLSILLKGGEL